MTLLWDPRPRSPQKILKSAAEERSQVVMIRRMREISRMFWLYLVLFPANAYSQASDIEVRFAWIDSRGCADCTVARLRLAIDGRRIFASSVMLQDYSELSSNFNRAIELTQPGDWKCANHTQGQSAPDPRLVGMNFEMCARLLSIQGSDYQIGLITKMKKSAPRPDYRLVTNITFHVEIFGKNACQARLMNALTQYESDPNVWVPIQSARLQECYFVTPG
jgi:hypothetical protein